MSSKRYEPYDYGEPIDEDEGHSGKPRFQPRDDILSASRGAGGTKKSSSRWVFISRKADIGLVLVLLLSTGLGIMWLISQLPVFVETASNHYYWARDVYATWGTPSMRWLFINLVVGVIVATSGLLSAFGGDSTAHESDRSTSGYDKGVDYRGAEPGMLHGRGDPAYGSGANQARFSGPGYESSLYNPYVEETAKERLHHEGSFEAWNHADDRHSEERGREEGYHRGSRHGSMEEPPPFARPVDPEVLRAARPISRQGSQRRGVPTPADDGVPMSSRDFSREMFDTPPRGGGGPESPRVEVPRESFREMPREMPPMDEPPAPPPRDTPTPREVSEPMAPDPVADEAPAAPEPEASEEVSNTGGGSRKEDAIEIISKVYDPVPELEDREADHGAKFHRLQTDSGIHYSPHVEEALADSSPARADALRKSHTFTLGRVIRRDQLVDFIEPLSRKLEGIGRKVSHKSSHSESGVHQSRELPSPLTPGAGANSLPAAIEAVGKSAPKPDKHNRRLSSEAIPATRRPLSSESGHSTVEGNIPKQVSVPVIPNKFPPLVPSSPSSPPLLKQRSIVYPPALLSQASTVVEEELSPPPSPPIEDAIPPPPPPHLKLPPASVLSTDEPSSFKFLVPPGDSPDHGPAAKSSKKKLETVSSSEDSKRPPSGKHSRTPSSTLISPASSQAKGGAGAGEAGSASGLDERSVPLKARKSNAGDDKAQEGKGGARLDRQESSTGKDDDLHQQIEDFLARFHENWRLQRQESLARYKKRLSELDEE